MSDDLVAFLRARLDEDERKARAAKPGPWHADGGSVYATHPTDEVVDYTDSAEHIARHDPARVLADIEGKRKVIDRYEEVWRIFKARETVESWQAARIESGALGEVLLAFAAVDAGHPDYQPKWRP